MPPTNLTHAPEEHRSDDHSRKPNPRTEPTRTTQPNLKRLITNAHKLLSLIAANPIDRNSLLLRNHSRLYRSHDSQADGSADLTHSIDQCAPKCLVFWRQGFRRVNHQCRVQGVCAKHAEDHCGEDVCPVSGIWWERESAEKGGHTDGEVSEDEDEVAADVGEKVFTG